MTIFQIIFRFLDSPQGDVQTYEIESASSETEAIEKAKALLRDQFPRNADQRYSVDCKRHQRI